MEFQTDTFDYHINWKTRGHHPGQHKSDQRGMGIEFAGHSNLLRLPGPKENRFKADYKGPIRANICQNI